MRVPLDTGALHGHRTGIGQAVSYLQLALNDRGNVDDAEGFAAALDSVVHQSHGRQQLIDRGHANVTRFSWRRCADEMVALYREVLESS